MRILNTGTEVEAAVADALVSFQEPLVRPNMQLGVHILLNYCDANYRS